MVQVLTVPADVGRYPTRPRAESSQSIVSISSLDGPASKKLAEHDSAWLCNIHNTTWTCITGIEAAQARTGSNRAVPSPCTSAKACIVYSAHSTTPIRHCRQSGKTMRASNGSISLLLLLIGYTSAHEIHPGHGKARNGVAQQAAGAQIRDILPLQHSDNNSIACI